MRKNVFGRQLKRDTNERKALFKSLMSSLVLHGRIKTTESKAKAIKGQVDKLISRVKKNNINPSSFLNKYLTGNVGEKLVTEIVPRFSTRTSGYTRLIKLGNRFSDNGATVIMEWVEMDEVQSENKQEKETKETKGTKETKAKETKTRKRRITKKEVKK